MAASNLKVSRKEVRALLQRAQALLANGDIGPARLLLEHLAEAGHGPSAESLARSYDPAYFPVGLVTGVAPSLAEAVKWYRVAAKLGQRSAARRLREIAKLSEERRRGN